MIDDGKFFETSPMSDVVTKPKPKSKGKGKGKKK